MNASRRPVTKLDTQMMSDVLSCIFNTITDSLFTKSSVPHSPLSKNRSLILPRVPFPSDFGGKGRVSFGECVPRLLRVLFLLKVFCIS